MLLNAIYKVLISNIVCIIKNIPKYKNIPIIIILITNQKLLSNTCTRFLLCYTIDNKYIEFVIILNLLF